MAEPAPLPSEPIPAALAGRPAHYGELIRPNTVLPAVRRGVELHTADGLTLVGELALPEGRPPVATMVCLHPLPTHGGSQDSHLFRKAAWRLPALAGIAVLRFNTRGTAGSEGLFDGGDAERYDVAAALDLVEAGVDGRSLPAPWLVGWSFGSELVLRYGYQDDTVVGGILISPPLKKAGDADLAGWAASGKPLVSIVAEYDDYLRPAEARDRFARVPQCQLVEVEGAKHLFVGARYADRVLDEVSARLAPGSTPLPTFWEPAG
jgi:alpha/beta superfamily hydrolase